MTATKSNAAETLSSLLSPTLVKAFRDIVREELAGDAYDRWEPHTSWPFGSTRHNASLARSGAIPGCRKVGKVWLARRSSLDAYIATLPEPTPAANDVDETDARDDEERELDTLLDSRTRRAPRKS